MSILSEISFNTKFLFSIILITLIIDILFQKTIFSLSIIFVSSLREKIPQENLSFWLILSHFGKEKIIFPIIYIIYICYPIKYSFLLFNVYFSSKFFVNFLKLSFQSPRPFWNNISIFGKCNNGFGNPSAHSFTTISIYSSICHVIISNNKNNFILKVILIFLTVFISIITCFSRIILGVHSIDQVIFGSISGLILYYYFFFVYTENNIKKEKNYVQEFLIYTILFSLMLLVTYFIYNIFYDENLIMKMSQLTILYFCPELLLHPSDKSLYLSLTLFGNVGCFYGKIITEYVLENINDIYLLKKLPDFLKDKSNFWKNNLYIISLGIYFFTVFNFYSYDIFFFWSSEWKKYIINTFLTGILLFGPITIIRTIIYENEGFEEKELIEEDLMKPAEIISNIQEKDKEINNNNIENYEPINV